MFKDILLTFFRISFSYTSINVISDISCFIKRKSLLAIAGPNGGGKSTLLKIATGILKPSMGYCLFHNIEKHKDIAYLPQVSLVNDFFPITVYDVVSFGLFGKKGFWIRVNDIDNDKVLDALTQVGLIEYKDLLFHELSGGQRQRALFARVIVQNSKLILLDEPFSAIDRYTRNDLIKIILGWYKNGHTVVVVLHDIPLIKEIFPNTLLLCRNFVAQGMTSDVLTRKNLMDARLALTNCYKHVI